MFKNYFKMAFRTFWRHKLNSFINLVGLSLGLSACILIAMYVSHERSYDKFHKDSDRIFTTVGEFKMGDETIKMTRMSHIVAEQLQENDSNIEETLRYYAHHQSMAVKSREPGAAAISESNIAVSDPNFFSFFSFDLVQGHGAYVLTDPFSVVLTQTMATKYFGESNPIGKQLSMTQDSTYNFTVTGVMKDFPTNSSINSDFIISISSLNAMTEMKPLIDSNLFQGGSFTTYLKLNAVENVDTVEQTALRLDQLSNETTDTTYVLDAFTNTHAQYADTGRFNYLNVFPIVALLILILALTNYISLTTARAGTRAKEVGVRKISGANRKSLALQFYIESAIFVCISFALGIVLSFMFKERFLELLNIDIGNSFYLNWSFLSVLIGLLVFAIMASGVYPAMVLSSFNPIKNFKNKVALHAGGTSVRKVFTTFQFTIAVLLIVCGIVMSAQLDYMRNKDTGLVRSNVLMIPVETSMMTNAAAFRNEVEQMADVSQTTLAMNKMYGPYNAYFVSKENSDDHYTVSTFNVDEHFIETLGVNWHLKPEGRTAYSTDNKVIINETTIHDLGLQPDPRGEQMNFGNQFFEIAGVVKDFHYTSLESPIKPLAFFISSEASANKNIIGTYSSYLYVKLAEQAELARFLDRVEGIYRGFDASTPFSYQFMDDAFDVLYKAEERLSTIFYVFMILALLIAGLGLLGLVTFMAEKRVKEIGIRKVLGASITEIVLLLSSDFMKLIALAIVIAVPLAWYVSDSWLSYFAYKTAMPWWSFVVAGLVAIALSLITLGVQGVKAAIANPVDALRAE